MNLINQLMVNNAVKNISIEQWHLIKKYAETYDVPVFPKSRYSFPSGRWNCVCFNIDGQIDLCTENYENAEWITIHEFIEKIRNNKVLPVAEHYKECLVNLLEGLECREIDLLITDGEPSDYRNLGVGMADRIREITAFRPLNLHELEQKLDNALSKESSESLTKWLKDKQ